MTQTPTPSPSAAPAAPSKAAMTAAQAAKAVKRQVVEPVMKDGKPVRDDNKQVVTKVRLVDVKPAEVLDFKDYGSHVVVVTKDGQKFSSADELQGEAEAA